MNKFQQHVTQTAFNLSLSRAMIDYILTVEAGYIPVAITSMIATGEALIRRGLIEPVPGQHMDLTEAGKLLAPLLREAGFEANLFNHIKRADVP